MNITTKIAALLIHCSDVVGLHSGISVGVIIVEGTIVVDVIRFDLCLFDSFIISL